jgi:hypothetical protein
VLFSFVSRVIATLEAGYSLVGLNEVGLGFGGNNSFVLVFLIKLHEFGQIELRLLEYLCLVDKDVLERENF